MIQIVERCLRGDDDGAWVELWQIFENESAHELRHILAEHGVAPEDADAVVVRYWQDLARNKKTLWSFVGNSLRELKDWLVDTSVMFTLKLVEAGKVVVGKGKQEPKSKKQRQLGIEALEPKMLMAADLLNFQLQHDTGTAGDYVSSNPTVTAVVGSLQAGGESVTVQFDHDGDQVPEATVTGLAPGDTVLYDPSAIDIVLAATDGPFAINYRTLEVDSYGGEVSAGAWQSFGFEIDAGDTVQDAVNVTLTPNVENVQQRTIGNGELGDNDIDMFKVDLNAGQTLNVDVDAQNLDDDGYGGYGGSLSNLNSFVRIFFDEGNGTDYTEATNTAAAPKRSTPASAARSLALDSRLWTLDASNSTSTATR